MIWQQSFLFLIKKILKLSTHQWHLSYFILLYPGLTRGWECYGDSPIRLPERGLVAINCDFNRTAKNSKFCTKKTPNDAQNPSKLCRPPVLLPLTSPFPS
ncbi:hypothetical protein Y1Q_0021205 [Alligator mississippiensis]|uniref:Uncharacterized protein n=1 Tax=Alligator mississippiensis TaxID=8496 RepID=A0A151MRW4_ALLMI|nr:hypothetical protein Y1Q_0021205 [Alligator mississippiensis]